MRLQLSLAKLISPRLTKLLRFPLLLIASTFALALSGCGFNLPSQTSLNEIMPELRVEGDYHQSFYKMVVNRLRANGVKVYAQSSDYTPTQTDIPILYIPMPSVQEEVVAVDSLAQNLESEMLISVFATLSIPNHRPIVIRNSITRSALNKPGQILAADTERVTVRNETLEQLADELVIRLSYLGRFSDPDATNPMPNQLVLAKDEDDPELLKQYEIKGNLTLIEALQLQEQSEQRAGKTVTLDELNNGQDILNKSYQLPKVKPKRLDHTLEGAKNLE